MCGRARNVSQGRSIVSSRAFCHCGCVPLPYETQATPAGDLSRCSRRVDRARARTRSWRRSPNDRRSGQSGDEVCRSAHGVRRSSRPPAARGVSARASEILECFRLGHVGFTRPARPPRVVRMGRPTGVRVERIAGAALEANERPHARGERASAALNDRIFRASWNGHAAVTVSVGRLQFQFVEGGACGVLLRFLLARPASRCDALAAHDDVDLEQLPVVGPERAGQAIFGQRHLA
jgi:hypothetical protein